MCLVTPRNFELCRDRRAGKFLITVFALRVMRSISDLIVTPDRAVPGKETEKNSFGSMKPASAGLRTSSIRRFAPTCSVSAPHCGSVRTSHQMIAGLKTSSRSSKSTVPCICLVNPMHPTSSALHCHWTEPRARPPCLHATSRARLARPSPCAAKQTARARRARKRRRRRSRL